MNGITKSTAACALGIALLAGSVAVATPALAAPSGTATSASTTADQGQTLTITGGLGYTPGVPTTITGTATPGASVQVYGAGVDATVRADAAGVWSAAGTLALQGEAEEVLVYSAGHNLALWAKPGNGDGVKPETKQLAITGGLGYTPGTPTTLTGVATPFSSVLVHGAGVSATVRADASGAWSAEGTQALQGEAQEVFVYSAGQNVVLWAKPGNDDGLAPEYRQIAVTSDLGGFVPGETRTISGVATDHAEVQLHLENPGGRPVPGETGPLTTRADANGNWSFEVADLVRIKGYVYGSGSGSTTFEFTR